MTGLVNKLYSKKKLWQNKIQNIRTHAPQTYGEFMGIKSQGLL